MRVTSTNILYMERVDDDDDDGGSQQQVTYSERRRRSCITTALLAHSLFKKLFFFQFKIEIKINDPMFCSVRNFFPLFVTVKPNYKIKIG